MPRAELKLIPGVDLNKTLNLNESGISDTNMIRFIKDRNGLGLPQKMGGFFPYYGPMPSIVRQLKAYEDLNNVAHLAAGCEQTLNVITNGQIIDITPQFRSNFSVSAPGTLNGISYVIANTGTTDFTSIGSTTNDIYAYFTATGAGTGTGTVVPVIKMSTSAGSTFVTIVDTEIPASTNDYIEFKESVSLGGVVFQGPYAITNATGTTYVISVDNPATFAEDNFTFTAAASLKNYRTYVIQSTGTTTWTSLGAASSRPGTVFLKNGTAGTGTGTARLLGVPAYYMDASTSSNIVTVYLDNHTYGVGSNYYIADPVTVNNVTLYGSYTVQSVGSGATASTFTIQAANSSSTTYAGNFVIGQQYKIFTVGTTDFTLIGASSNSVGIVFTATGAGSGTGTAYCPNPVPANSGIPNTNFYISPAAQNQSLGYGLGGYGYGGYGTGVSTTITAGSFVVGTQYVIASIGTTDFTLIGASRNAIGVIFTATGVGTGTGTASVYTTGYTINAVDWTLDNFGEILVACPFGGPIYTYQFDTASSIANLPSQQAPLYNNGAFVAMPQRQIVAWGSSLGLEQDPLLLRWSDVEDATVWIGTATNQAGSIRIPTGSKIVTCIQGPQQAFIWTDLDCWSMQYIGPPLIYSLNKIGSNCGAISPKSVAQYLNSVYWMSQKQFFVNRGNGPEPLDCPVWDFVFQTLNLDGGDVVSAGQFITGKQYTITSVGTTDFTAIGANSNAVGTVFTASGPGSGSGSAYIQPYINNIRCGVNSQFNEIIWYFPSTAYATYPVFYGDLIVGETYRIGHVGVSDFTTVGAYGNDVGEVFVATGSGFFNGPNTGWCDVYSTVGENNAYVKYNITTNEWDYGYTISKAPFSNELIPQFIGRTAWIDQSVLGNPIGAGLDNFIYQHEVGYDCYITGNAVVAMTSYFSTGYFQVAEADQLIFIDQIWPDFKWGVFSGDPTLSENGLTSKDATINMYILYTNDVDEVEGFVGPGHPNLVGPFYFNFGQTPAYASCRIRARFIRFYFYSGNAGGLNTWWRLGGIRYRFQPDGRY